MAAESFWDSNPCVPSWSQRIQGWWNNDESSRILRGEPGWTINVTPVLGYQLRRAVVADALPLSEFWGRYYANSSSCFCAVPVHVIQENIQTQQWEVYVVIQQSTRILVGSVVRRWLVSPLHIKDKTFNKAAIVDFFCTAPGVRKKGIGRWLLATLQNKGPVPLPPHLILWEGVQVKIPPTVAALYWNRRAAPKGQERGVATQIQGEDAKKVWNTLCKGRDIYMDWPAAAPTAAAAVAGAAVAKEVTIWRTVFGDVVIWNTYHWHLPETHLIGIVLCATNAAAVNACAEAKGMPFGILVAPGEFAEGEKWNYDSPFQWMIYNLITPFCSNQFPVLYL